MIVSTFGKLWNIALCLLACWPSLWLDQSLQNGVFRLIGRAVVTSNFSLSLMHLQCGQQLLTETMTCNKNLFHLHHERRTYSLTKQIDDAYVAFMRYRRQQQDFTPRSCRLCCLTLLDSLKMNLLFIKECRLLMFRLNYSQHISAIMASVFSYRLKICSRVGMARLAKLNAKH